MSRYVLGVTLACALAATPALAADAWPARPVTVICPFAAGVSTDILTRAIANALSERIGQQFVVEDRPGATGNIAAATAAKAAPDGYTLFVATLGPLVTNKFMYKSLPYDSDRAFAPITMLGYSALTIASSPKLPVSTFQDLLTYAKTHPLNAGTVGVGSQAHITLELINKLAGIAISHVPYRNGTQALPDLISGDLDVGYNYIPTFVPAILTGTIHGLAVTSRERTKELPNIPTVAESGFPGFEANGWNALVAPAGTPQAVIDKVNAAMNAYLASAAGRDQLAKMGMTPMGGTPAETQAYLNSEKTRWGPIIKEANITLQ